MTKEVFSKLLKRKEDVPQAGLKFMDELEGEGKGHHHSLGWTGPVRTRRWQSQLRGSVLRLRWSALLITHNNRMEKSN